MEDIKSMKLNKWLDQWSHGHGHGHGPHSQGHQHYQSFRQLMRCGPTKKLFEDFILRKTKSDDYISTMRSNLYLQRLDIGHDRQANPYLDQNEDPELMELEEKLENLNQKEKSLLRDSKSKIRAQHASEVSIDLKEKYLKRKRYDIKLEHINKETMWLIDQLNWLQSLCDKKMETQEELEEDDTLNDWNCQAEHDKQLIKTLESNKEELMGTISQIILAYNKGNKESSKPARQEICTELQKNFMTNAFHFNFVKWWSLSEYFDNNKLSKRSQEISVGNGPISFHNEFVSQHIQRWTRIEYELRRDNTFLEDQISNAELEIPPNRTILELLVKREGLEALYQFYKSLPTEKSLEETVNTASSSIYKSNLQKGVNKLTLTEEKEALLKLACYLLKNWINIKSKFFDALKSGSIAAEKLSFEAANLKLVLDSVRSDI